MFFFPQSKIITFNIIFFKNSNVAFSNTKNLKKAMIIVQHFLKIIVVLPMVIMYMSWKRIRDKGNVEVNCQVMRVKSSRNPCGFLQCVSLVCRMWCVNKMQQQDECINFLLHCYVGMESS